MRHFPYLIVCFGLALSLTSCGGGKPQTSTSGNVSGVASGSGEDLSAEPVADPLPDGWAGLIKLYYRNDASDYGSKALWIWASGVDGAQYAFDNVAAPDDYGVYHILDLSSAPFVGIKLTSISFIVKPQSGWDGQSTDTVCTLNNFSSTLEKDANGKEMITIYSSDNGNGTIDTYSKRSDAEGDRLGSFALLSDWTSLQVKGTGKSDGRATADVGKIASYALYGFTPDYYRLNEIKKAKNKPNYLLKEGTPDSNDFTIALAGKANPSTAYYLEARFVSDPSKIKQKFATKVALYDTADFIANYTDSSADDLGLSWTADGHETYKIWSPTASRIEVRRYYFGTPKALAIDGKDHPTFDVFGANDLTLGDKGIWSYTDPDARYYNFYTFVVTNEGSSNEVADPYAKSSGINGIRSAILSPAEWAKATPEGFADSIASLRASHPLSAPNALTVYEAHVRDFTADSSWISNKNNANGTYEAFAESGTSYGDGTNSVTTGFDHLKELGVNALQLLPVFDQDNDERTLPVTINGVTTFKKPGYNWGYNPLNYNVVEGAYSSDPFSSKTKITEYKDLIKSCADNGIRVIMDVVYNHVSSVSSCAFNKIMPKYYFRLNADGSYASGTGCGNEIASERTMARAFIVNSVKFWAEEYGVKGFRFDLMGSLDTDTMKAVKAACYSVDPEIVVYGEPWTLSSALDTTKYAQATTANVYSKLYDCGHGDVVGCFNDDAYGGLVGNTGANTQNNYPGYGFINRGPNDVTLDDMKRVSDMFIGANSGDGGNPAQTVNYVACHDNYTLYDHLNYTVGSGMANSDDNVEALQATVGAQSAILYSEGIAFINGGDEIFRQKIMTSANSAFLTAQTSDYVPLSNGTRLMRNSYAYGDDVNSFKWARKANSTLNPYYLKIKEAVALRNLMMGDTLGKTYDEITSGDATTWGDLKQSVDVTAAYTKGASAAYYVLLGGRMDADWSGIGIGNGSLEARFSSSGAHTVGQMMTITNSSIGAGKYELLLVKRIS